MKKITYHTAILITLFLSALPSIKADLGDSPEEMNENWGKGRKEKPGGLMILKPSHGKRREWN